MSRPLLVVLSLFAFAPFVLADTYSVTTAADSGPGSLRQAILDANAHSGNDIILSTISTTIVLKSALPPVTDTATIGFASGLQTLQVDGRGAGPGADGFVFAADDCWLMGAIVGGFGGTAVVFRGKRGAADGVLIGADRIFQPLPNGAGIRIDPGADATLGTTGTVFTVNNHGHGIDIRGAAVIRNAETHANDGDGLHVEGASSLKVDVFKSYDNGGNGVTIAHSLGVPALQVKFTRVTPNGGLPIAIEDAHDFAITLSDVKAATGVPMVVRNSTGITIGGSILQSAADGLDLIDSEVTSSASITGCKGHGVAVSGGSVVIAGSITGNGGDGVHVEHGKLVSTAQAEVSSNGGDGIALLDHSSGSNVASGTIVAHNGGVGVRIDNSSLNTIGVRTFDNRQGPCVISGAAATGNTISGANLEGEQGNAAAGLMHGTALGRAGVLITGGASNNRVTQTSIAIFSGPAVGIESGSGNRIDGLDVVTGTRLPIDLDLDGPSVGGTIDPAGANLRQPAPVIEQVFQNGSTDAVSGLIPGSHGGRYDLDLYTVVPSEWHWTKTVAVQPDVDGHFTATFQLPTASLVGSVFSATVTDAAGNTSEMSASRGTSVPAFFKFLQDFNQVTAGTIYTALVVRIGDTSQPATVDWDATGAVGGTGSTTIAHGSLRFEPGEVRKSVSVDTTPLLPCNVMPCATLYLHLSNAPTVASDGNTSEVHMFPPSVLSGVGVAFAASKEGDALGATVVRLRSLGSHGKGMTIDYHTESGTATAGADFTAVRGTATIAPDEADKLIGIPILGDHDEEQDESFHFVIDRVDGKPVGTTSDIALLDDDATPTIDVQVSGGRILLTALQPATVHTPTIAYEAVRMTPFGEQLVAHEELLFSGSNVFSFDTTAGPMEVHFTSDAAKFSTNTVRLEQQPGGSFVVDQRPLRPATTETIRVARLTPADVPLNAVYTIRLSQPVSGPLHFEAGQTIATFDVAVPPLQGHSIGQLDVDVQVQGSTTAVTTIVPIVGMPAGPLLTVSGPLRDDRLVCVTFDASEPLPLPGTVPILAGWFQRYGVTIPAGGTHGAFCTDHSASTFDSWISFGTPDNVRLSTGRVWLGIDPPSNFRSPVLRILGPAMEEPRTGTGYVDFVVTRDVPVTQPTAYVAETVDGTAMAGRDYTHVLTVVSFATGESRQVVRVPVLATGGATPPEGKNFFLAITDGLRPVAAGIATLVPAGKGISRRRSG